MPRVELKRGRFIDQLKHAGGLGDGRSVVKSTSKVETFPSGSTLLDLANGGGWARDRVINIVGDRSSGKTLLAIEAAANFARLYGAEKERYNEAEFALGREYAYSIGLPRAISFTGDDGEEQNGGSRTVEDFYADITDFLKKQNGQPCFYALDSLDAISTETEMARKFREATYGTDKAAAVSEFFRKEVGNLANKHCTLFIISQTRDLIGAMFGEKKTRSGGRALNFYASQIVWLYEIEKIDRTVTGVKRIVGVKVRAKNKKNKIGKAFREVDFPIYFNYGIDDEMSMIEWLEKSKLGAATHFISSEGLKDIKKCIAEARTNQDYAELRECNAILKDATKARWNEIEDALEPTIHKYAQ